MTNISQDRRTVHWLLHLLEGNTIVFETYGDVMIVYFYDEVGAPIGMAYRKASEANLELDMEDQFDFYLFTKNLQGDILNIYSEDGTLVASYNYEAWGNHTATNYTSDNIGDINPFRYRGYYQDTETGFYYLNSRYYDSKMCKFINADAYVNANGDFVGFNMYAYCSNNPVMNVDNNGNSWSSFWKSIGKWFSNTFGAGVVSSQDYETMKLDTVIYGNETGMSTTAVIAGDISKPISVFVTNASEWWKFWEYKMGIQININGGGFSYSTNFLETEASVSFENTTYEVMSGINKFGYTVSYDANFGKCSAGSYYHEYIRTIPTAVAVGLIYVSYGALAPYIGQLINVPILT